MTARPAFFAIALFLVTSGFYALPQNGYDLFQQALVKERAEGKIEDAARMYEQIVKNYASDRALVAKALLQMGGCYEQLGRAEARKAYEHLVKDYADQRATVAEARARLATLEAAAVKPAGITTRPLWGGPDFVDTMGSVSADGRNLSFTDWDTGDLGVADLQSAAKRRLTAKGSWTESPEFAEFSVISPNASQIAYSWANKAGFYELRLIERRGGEPRVLYRNEDIEYVQPFDWSPDGKQILAIFRRADRTHQIVLVSLVNGSLRVLKTLDWRMPWKMAFSPDGRYFAYDFPPLEDAPERDLLVMAVDGSQEMSLVKHPAHDFLLGWFPRGDRVLFASNRKGTNGAWAIRVENGRPQGEAELLKPGIGRVIAKNFTKAGSYFYAVATELLQVYTGTLDPATGKLIDTLTPFTERFEEGKLAAAWSPDGTELAYLLQSSLVRGGEGANTLAIQTLSTGHVRSIPLKVTYANKLGWLPGGKVIIVGGIDLKGRGGLFRVDLVGGAFEPILYGSSSRFVIAPDGKKLFYGRRGTIVARDLQTDEEKDLYRFSGSYGIALSPDGQWLALKVNLSTGDERLSTSIQILPAAGGEARTLLTLDTLDTSDWRQMAWSPDGKYIFFADASRLWQIPAAGGVPQLVAENLRFINSISIHPDGRQLAVSAGNSKYEIWVMENLLPMVKASR